MGIVQGKSVQHRLWAAHSMLWAFIVFSTYPFLRCFLLSISDSNYYDNLTLIPKLSLDHWRAALGVPYIDWTGHWVPGRDTVWRWLWNSIKVAGVATVLAGLFALTTAYAFARFRFHGRKTLDNGLFIAQMFPGVLMTVGLFTLFNRAGDLVSWLGIDQHPALTLAYTGSTAIALVWAFKGYFHTLPREIEEAAHVDGASHWQTFWHILLPLARPMILVMLLFSGTGLMYEYPLASFMIYTSDKATISVGMMSFSTEVGGAMVSAVGDEAAAILLVSIPGTLGFFIAQRWISETVGGGVKQ